MQNFLLQNNSDGTLKMAINNRNKKAINFNEPSITISDAIRLCVIPNEIDEYMSVNGGAGAGGIKNTDLNSGFPKYRNDSDNCESSSV